MMKEKEELLREDNYKWGGNYYEISKSNNK